MIMIIVIIRKVVIVLVVVIVVILMVVVKIMARHIQPDIRQVEQFSAVSLSLILF